MVEAAQRPSQLPLDMERESIEAKDSIMRVAVDAHMIGERQTGAEYYTLGLIAGLARVDSENHYTLLTTHRAALKRALNLPSNFEPFTVHPGSNLPRVAWAMPRACRQVRAQVLHVSYTAPPICPCPTVVTIHDIAYEFFPRFFSPRDRWLLSITVPFSCRRAARVIAVSECTKHDLIDQYGIPETKIRVIYEAANDKFSQGIPQEKVTHIQKQYADGRRYILAVGNIQPRKNLKRLIEAFAALIAENTEEDMPVLVIGGQAKWQSSAIYQQVEQQGLSSFIHFTGYIPDEDLPALYRGAEIFVYPSIYEGFGLPPLEAMASGIPVICSKASALPEAVGDAALLIDPLDTGSIVQALRELVSDAARRQALTRAGLARAAQFSWEKTARETIAVYEEATHA
jgi:glycosyltransferase involved in cell wall biosynthesis